MATVAEHTGEDGIRKVKGVRMHALNALLVFFAAVVSIVFFQTIQETNEAYDAVQEAADNYIACEAAASQMKEGSNYLTTQVRRFVVTRNPDYLVNYFWEANVNMRRQNAVATLEMLQEGESKYLEESLDYSVELMDLEYYAMKLVVEATGMSVPESASLLDDIDLSAQDAALSPDEKLDRATSIVFGDDYTGYVERIEGAVANCKDSLIVDIQSVQAESSDKLNSLLTRQQVLTVMLFLVMIVMILLIVVLMLWPMRTYIVHIRRNEKLPEAGAYELRYLAESYNLMYEENAKNHDSLRRKAEHDYLTGLYNRSVFENLLNVYEDEPYALILIDADYFKEVNDSLGHDKGDAMLQKVSRLLSKAFRTTDYPCRIGGDEFAVLMTGVDERLKSVISSKVESVMEGLRDTSDGLPPMTLSIGIAFNAGDISGEQVFKNADTALYDAKEAGRNGYRFFEG